ncbi:hypothetical protein R1flu_006860 [Riccia fluitans]|uniref:VOC domain-containing protein n=1 Tax=Riccia fluitans TaxID=41844 RepID=A0ABD1YX86_9MARC
MTMIQESFRVRVIKYLIPQAAMSDTHRIFTSSSLSNKTGGRNSTDFDEEFQVGKGILQQQRAGVRLQQLSSQIVGGSRLVVGSLHSVPYRDHDSSAKRLLHLRSHHQVQEASAVDQRAEGSGPKMAQEAKFAYTVVYVHDVEQTANFYEKAFGMKIRRMDQSRKWGELESGQTTIAFTPLEQREARITGGVHAPDASEQRSNVELSFSFQDVDAAFKHAVDAGAVAIASPEDKPWGQRVGYVRDINGVTIRVGSFVHES